MELNNRMKGLIQDLGAAMHQALTRDDRIKLITNKIRDHGYDIYLIMEANIALDRREGRDNGKLFLHTPEEEMEMHDIRFNNYDEHFLANLKIKVDD